MASRYRSISQPALSLIKSTVTKPASKSVPTSFFLKTRSPVTTRRVCELGCVQSLLPLHSAVSSARLTSCLGVDSRMSRSLSQGMLCSANPGVWFLHFFFTPFLSKWVSAHHDKRFWRPLTGRLESLFTLPGCSNVKFFQVFLTVHCNGYIVGRILRSSGVCCNGSYKMFDRSSILIVIKINLCQLHSVNNKKQKVLLIPHAIVSVHGFSWIC